MDTTQVDAARTTADALVHYVARELVAQRARVGLSIRRAAEESGLGVSTVHRIEKEQRVPDIEQLAILANTYGTDLWTLMRSAEREMERGGLTIVQARELD